MRIVVLFLMSLSLYTFQNTDAQDTLFIEEPEISNFKENVDSLLNIYYINQALESMIDDADFEVSDSLLPDFPDSVYIARLRDIPSVVDLSYNRLVKNYINVYTKKRREQMRYMLAVSSYYFPMIEGIFDLYDIPYELKYLAIIESALNPRAVSRAGAVGTWQFMYGTARMYGLRINSLADERKDPVKSTHAAAKFLKNLYGIYNDWTLALAAYNCGPGNVNKAIRRSGGKRDFWEIYYFLPRETRGYVPAFIAATYTMNYHREHNLLPDSVDIVVHADTIMLNQRLHLQQVSEVLDIPVKYLRDLNPQYRYDIIPGSLKNAYALAIPVKKVGEFIELRDSVIAYKDSVYFSDEKLITSPSRVDRNYQVDLPADKYDKIYYTVKSGDSPGLIADWYDVRLSDLRYWNNIRRNLIRSGQKLVVYKPKGNSERYMGLDGMTFSEKQRFAGREVREETEEPEIASDGNQTLEFFYYTVRPGDTLWEIAQKYPGVTDTDISKWNNLTDSNRIKPGQKIRIKRM
ncbi:MAG: transglycosylase SLT domain-containing protein [Bacteroidales bacterium]|nr:transglycosylase SLT domain-containing protein [Bacteroidales bacterium]